MDFKAHGKIYTLRDWLSSGDFTILNESRFNILKVIGPLCDWDQEKMSALQEDQAELMKMIAKSGISLGFINEATDQVIQNMLQNSDVIVGDLAADVVNEMRIYITQLLQDLESKKA